MQRLASLLIILFCFTAPSFAEPSQQPDAAPQTCAESQAAAAAGIIQLAQSDCRGHCSSMRGYCMSTCRDSQCRAICNDRYQSCVSSCRR